MPYRRKENVQVVIGKETTFNQGQTTPDGYQFPFAQLSGGITREFGKSPILRGDAFESQPILGMYRGNFRLRAAATLETVPRLFRLIGGAISTSGTGPYTHTVKGATDGSTPSIWVEKWHTDVAKGDLYYGLKLASIQLAVAGRQAAPVLLEVALASAGKQDVNRTTRYDTTPITSMMSGPFPTLAEVSVLVDGAAPAGSITGAQIQVQLAQDPIDLLDGQYYSAGLAQRWYEVSGQIEGLFDDADYLRGLDGLTKAISIKVTKPGDPTRYFELKVPSAFLHITDVGDVSGSGTITQRVEFTGYFDAGAGSSWVCTTVNDTSGYGTW